LRFLLEEDVYHHFQLERGIPYAISTMLHYVILLTGFFVVLAALGGEVRRIGIRACVLRTADGSEVIVPNGAIISNKVTNWTFSDRYRAVEVPVSVARGVAPQRVVELLKSVAANHPSVAKQPAPQAYVVNFAYGRCELWTSSLDGSIRGLGSGAEWSFRRG
jgi:potassium-dependent mechanosensitive channel